jgi:flagella basal body P-ring formation protein FlgA
VGIIRADNQEIADKAGSLQLGQFSSVGQRMIIDRTLIRSRMASEYMDISNLELTGAEETEVTQKHIFIESSRLVKVAEMALEADETKPSSVASWTAIKVPKDLSINSSSKNVEFHTSMMETNAPSCAKVGIDIFVDGKKAATETVTFRYRFSCRRAVAKTPIAAGTSISADNVKIETYDSTQPEPADWESPYGLVARRNISANTIIHKNMVGNRRSEVLVKRNDNVVVKIETPVMTISAVGRALEDGREGDSVKVRMNISPSSQRVIFARVRWDGTLEPIS